MAHGVTGPFVLSTGLRSEPIEVVAVGTRAQLEIIKAKLRRAFPQEFSASIKPTRGQHFEIGQRVGFVSGRPSGPIGGVQREAVIPERRTPLGISPISTAGRRLTRLGFKPKGSTFTQSEIRSIRRKLGLSTSSTITAKELGIKPGQKVTRNELRRATKDSGVITPAELSKVIKQRRQVTKQATRREAVAVKPPKRPTPEAVLIPEVKEKPKLSDVFGLAPQKQLEETFLDISPGFAAKILETFDLEPAQEKRLRDFITVSKKKPEPRGLEIIGPGGFPVTVPPPPETAPINITGKTGILPTQQVQGFEVFVYGGSGVTIQPPEPEPPGRITALQTFVAQEEQILKDQKQFFEGIETSAILQEKRLVERLSPEERARREVATTERARREAEAFSLIRDATTTQLDAPPTQRVQDLEVIGPGGFPVTVPPPPEQRPLIVGALTVFEEPRPKEVGIAEIPAIGQEITKALGRGIVQTTEFIVTAPTEAELLGIKILETSKERIETTPDFLELRQTLPQMVLGGNLTVAVPAAALVATQLTSSTFKSVIEKPIQLIEIAGQLLAFEVGGKIAQNLISSSRAAKIEKDLARLIKLREENLRITQVGETKGDIINIKGKKGKRTADFEFKQLLVTAEDVPGGSRTIRLIIRGTATETKIGGKPRITTTAEITGEIITPPSKTLFPEATPPSATRFPQLRGEPIRAELDTIIAPEKPIAEPPITKVPGEAGGRVRIELPVQDINQIITATRFEIRIKRGIGGRAEPFRIESAEIIQPIERAGTKLPPGSLASAFRPARIERRLEVGAGRELFRRVLPEETLSLVRERGIIGEEIFRLETEDVTRTIGSFVTRVEGKQIPLGGTLIDLERGPALFAGSRRVDTFNFVPVEEVLRTPVRIIPVPQEFEIIERMFQPGRFFPPGEATPFLSEAIIGPPRLTKAEATIKEKATRITRRFIKPAEEEAKRRKAGKTVAANIVEAARDRRQIEDLAKEAQRLGIKADTFDELIQAGLTGPTRALAKSIAESSLAKESTEIATSQILRERERIKTFFGTRTIVASDLGILSKRGIVRKQETDPILGRPSLILKQAAEELRLRPEETTRGPIIIERIDTKEKIKLREELAVTQKLKLTQEQETALEQITDTTLTLPIEFVKPILEKLKVPKPPIRRRAGIRHRPKPKRQGYDVLVKAKKSRRFFKANKKPFLRNRALNFGANVVDRTAARTFKIQKTAEKSDQRVDAKSFEKRDKFRLPRPKSRIRRPAFIEKTKFAIDTPGEKAGITAKGLLARSKKARRVGF